MEDLIMETKDIFGNEAKTEVKTAKSADVKKTTTRKTPAKAAAKETVNNPAYLSGLQLPVRGNLKSVSKAMPVRDAA